MLKERTKARYLCLQFLYQLDLRGTEVLDEMESFLATNGKSRSVREYASRLISGCIEHWQEIDQKIEKVAQNWTVSRMAVVDRNILRIAIYEMCYIKETPAKVAINEAIEMGKKFSTENSGAFINGILDNLASQS